MSRMNELAYDIEQLFIEGHSPRMIAVILECPVEIVYEWLEQENINEEVEDEEIYSPYHGA